MDEIRISNTMALVKKCMKKFIILYKSDQDPEEMVRNSTPEQMKSGMDVWMQWSNKAGNSIVDLGSPLGFGQIVTKTGAMKAPLGVSGYSVMQAESMEELLTKLKNHPHFMTPGTSTIEVWESMPMSM
ncbi:MAG: hypothetical protein OK457_02725 [Thaumarchaeota archaeon]|nr:hypothetical protein [Nitrososphaerota archaeon]